MPSSRKITKRKTVFKKRTCKFGGATPSPRTPSPRTPSPRTPSPRNPNQGQVQRVAYTLPTATKGLRYKSGVFQAADLLTIPRAKRIMLYGGCFCPPHKGHFSILEKNVKMYDAVYIFVWGKGVSRHGYSAAINAKIWDLFLQSLPIKDQKKVHIVTTPNDNSNPLIAGVKIILPLLEKQNPMKLHAKLGSDYDKTDSGDILEMVKELVQPILSPNTSIAYSERIKLNVTKRDLVGGPSATQFCKSLKKIGKEGTEESDIDRFLPDKVNDHPDIKKAVVELLLTECEV